MELKKSLKANIDRQRALFFEIGLLIALGIVLAAFEWGTKQETLTEEVFDRRTDRIFEDEMEPIATEPFQNSTPPPPLMPGDLAIVENGTPIEDYIEFPEFDLKKGPSIGPVTFNLDFGPRPEDTDNKELFDFDIPAEFMGGGTDKFQRWVFEHTKYPKVAEENRIEGKVIVKFIIDKKGNLTQINILRSEDQSFEEEVIRVLRKSPEWKPAIKKGKPVMSAYVIPVNFTLTK